MIATYKRPARTRALLPCVALLALAAFPAKSQSQAGRAASTSASARVDDAGARSNPKDDARRAKEAYRLGLEAEQRFDWQEAYQDYAEAANWQPRNKDYFARQEIAKSRLINQEVDEAERDAVSGKLVDARRELLAARYLAPRDEAIRERIEQLRGLEPKAQPQQESADDLEPPVRLEPQSGTRDFHYSGDTKGAYTEVARQFGVEAAFDPNLREKPVRFDLNGLDFNTATRLLGDMTGTFWVPLTNRLFFVAEDVLANRSDYEPQVMRTILLPASYTTGQDDEIYRMLREVTGINDAYLEERSHTITVRARPRDAALAADLVKHLDQPPGELILDIEVLEVNRNYARQFGIQPPQTGKIYSLSPQQIQQAQQSYQGLVNVISQVFGLPSSFSGLSPSQIASLAGSGESSLGSLLPPLVAFGGGQTLFLATVPGAAASFSEMLSAVRTGRRVLLRAQDGQPATFFAGERVPIALTAIQNSVGTQTGVANVSPSSFPTTEYPAGRGPVFVATASLRDNNIQDLITANFTDNTLSILLGKGDGTFAAQTTVPTGSGPAWIATGNFNSSSNAKDIDAAVADENANSVSIFLAHNDASGNPDGTLTPGQVLTAGAKPVSIAAANFRDASAPGVLDLAVANQGDDTISIFQGNGDGTFQPAVTPLQLPAGFAPAALAAADFNNDGHLDLAVADQGSNTVSVFPGNGDGTFQARTDYQAGSSPAWISAADLNGDGVPDLVAANSGSTVTDSAGNQISGDSVSVLLANGDGTFQSHVEYPAGTGPMSIAVADFNIDGLPDLAIADQTDNAVSILPGVGNGQFGVNLELNAGSGPAGIASADFNGDKRPDAAIANNGSDDVSVVLNAPGTGSGPGANNANSQIFPGAQFFDIGLKLKATPRMHPDREVTLQLDFSISSLAGQSFNDIPVVNNEQVTQTVRVKEGETTALAGILQPQVTDAIAGAPGLARLPGIGWLGKNENLQSKDSELLILVTPHVVRFAPRKSRVVYAGQGTLRGPRFRPELPREFNPRPLPPALQRAPGPQPASRPAPPRTPR